MSRVSHRRAADKTDSAGPAPTPPTGPTLPRHPHLVTAETHHGDRRYQVLLAGIIPVVPLTDSRFKGFLETPLFWVNSDSFVSVSQQSSGPLVYRSVRAGFTSMEVES